jgi:hypothetical protein
MSHLAKKGMISTKKNFNTFPIPDKVGFKIYFQVSLKTFKIPFNIGTKIYLPIHLTTPPISLNTGLIILFQTQVKTSIL